MKPILAPVPGRTTQYSQEIYHKQPPDWLTDWLAAVPAQDQTRRERNDLLQHIVR